MAENEINIVVTATDKASNALKGVRGSIITLNQGLQLAQQAFGAVQKVVEESVGAYVKYADQVRRLSQLNGTTAQETSKLIQVMDDHKVSTEALMMATRKLSQQGLSLTIDSLGKMSDEYLKLGSSSEKTKFLLDKFGRSGLQMAETMEQGSKALREQSAAISKNLILTERQVKAARQYEIQLDQLSDEVQGFKVALGTALMPTLLKTTEHVKTGLGAWGQMGGQLRTISDLLIDKGNPALLAYGRYIEFVLDKLGVGGGGVIDGLSEAEIIVHKMAKTTTVTAETLAADFERMNKALENTASLAKTISSGGSLQDLAMGLLDIKLAAGEISFEQYERLGVALGQLTPTAINIAQSIQYITDEAAKGYGDVKKWADMIAYLNSLSGSYSYNYTVTGQAGGYNPYTGTGASNPYAGNGPGATPAVLQARAAAKTTGDKYGREASGGSIPAGGMAWVGDTLAGGMAHAELVYAPQGAYVFNSAQSRSMGGSAPKAATGGIIPPMGGEMSLSSSTIRQLANELAGAMSKQNG